MATLFFSYSHKDESLRDELEVHLAMLKREGSIDAWHDRKILAGDDLDHAIDAKLVSADVILLLVSPDFLASSYCYDVEVKRAMERHHQGSARVIAVILRPCDWQSTPFAKLLVTPTDGKPITKWPDRDEAFLDVVKQIRKALPETPPALVFGGFHDPAETFAKVMGNVTAPRSSNLRVKKNFTEADKDRFMDEAFDFMALFFEGSLNELQQRHAGIEGRFKRIDAHCFTAVIYRNGEAVSRCSIRHKGPSAFSSGITYSHDDRGNGSSFNEVLSIEVGDQSLSLRPMGISSVLSGRRDSQLSSEGAAELYWSMLIEPLQR